MVEEAVLAEFNKNIKALNESVARSNSLRRNIFLSLLKGVATALGATIVAAVVIAVLARGVRTLSDIPVLGPLIESTQVEQYIN
ncbi:MAG: DUF5665 domain-containing protein [bacterium]